MKDKKFLIEMIIALVIMAAVAFAGAYIESKRPIVSEAQEMKMSVTTSAEEKANGKSTTQEAELQPNEAIDLIANLSEEQLQLKNKDKYSFMMNNSAFQIDGEKYIQIIAAIKKETGKGSISITPVAKYYVRFDGKVLLREDMKNAGTFYKIKK